VAVGLRLGFALAMPLTENRQLKADLWDEYKTEIREAAGADGSQGRSERVRSDHFSEARR
jgi:hypothetical protein